MPAHLSVGQIVGPLQVPSEEHYFGTGVLLDSGAAYEIAADQSEWTDSAIPSTAAGNPDPVLAQQVFQGLLRCQEGLWFELVGAVGRSDAHLFPVGMRKVWTYESHSVEAEPELQLFANDAFGFYFNNHGSIGVTITRIS